MTVSMTFIRRGDIAHLGEMASFSQGGGNRVVHPCDGDLPIGLSGISGIGGHIHLTYLLPVFKKWSIFG